MTIDEETVMDDKNLATIFCPFCKKEMEPDLMNRRAASMANNLSSPVN